MPASHRYSSGLAIKTRMSHESDDSVRPKSAATQSSGEHYTLMSPMSPTFPQVQTRLEDRRPASRSSKFSQADARKMNTDSSKGRTKQTGGVLGFLSLKEPSALAFEEFAQAQRQKAKQSDGTRHKSHRLSGVSTTKKLPDHVPKVNSKWDGLPDSAKRRSEAPGTGRSRRSSQLSTSSSGTPRTSASRDSKLHHGSNNAFKTTSHTSTSSGSNETKRPFGSLSSKPAAVNASHTASQSPRPRSTNGSPVSLMEKQAVSPPLAALEAVPVEATIDNKPQTFLHPPSPSLVTFDSSPEVATVLEMPELEAPESLAAQELDASGRSSTTPDAHSPLTPPADEAEAGLSTYIGCRPLSPAAFEAASPAYDMNASFLNSDTEHEDVKQRSRSGKGAVNFSRRLPRQSSPQNPSDRSQTHFDAVERSWLEERDPVMSSTLKNSDGRIEPFLTDTFAAYSRQTGEVLERPITAVSPAEIARAAAELAASNSASNTPPPLGESVHSSKSASAESVVTARKIFHYADEARGITPDAEEARVKDHNEPSRSSSDVSLSASSVMSLRWQMSPKERLGLGGRIRRGEILPWELNADPADETEPGDTVRAIAPCTTTITAGAAPPGGERKFKRLSLRLGGRR